MRSWRRRRKWFKGKAKEKMATVLCVIDVQEKFSAAKFVVPEVVHQINLARKRKAGVLIVEYGNDPSYEEVYNALKGYKDWMVVKKDDDDGSMEIMHAMDKNPIYRGHKVRVCGVNACACVQATAIGLHDSGLFSKIEIAEAATNCTHGNSDNCVAGLLEKLK